MFRLRPSDQPPISESALGFATPDLDEALQEQATKGGYLLRVGDVFYVLDREAALKQGWNPHVLERTTFVQSEEPSCPDFSSGFRPPPTISWKAVGLAVPAYLGLVLVGFLLKPWERGNRDRTPPPPISTAKERVVMVDLRTHPEEPHHERSSRALPGRDSGGGRRNDNPGGSTGSRYQAEVDMAPLSSLPDYSGNASLELIPTPNPSGDAIRIPASPLLGPGLGRGKGTGVGDGIGPGRGKRGGLTSAEKASLAAERWRLLDPKDFVVTRMVTPTMNLKGGGLGSVVCVRLLVNAEGLPIFGEALSGPEHLRSAAVRGGMQWGFRLAPHIKAKAPVVIVINFTWKMS